MSLFKDQAAFMKACGQLHSEGLNVETALWKTLIGEEYTELRVELQKFFLAPTANNKANIAKEAIDLIYVVAGLLNNLEIPAEKVWTAVHESNMAKVDPVTGTVTRRGDGKILKPEGWKSPDILSIILEEQHAHHKLG